MARKQSRDAFTPDELAHLRKHFERWKAENNTHGALTDNPIFRAALHDLIVEHGYGLTTIGDMLGVTRERVRQWANAVGIATRHRRGGGRGHAHGGSLMRVWDDTANRFVTLADGYMPAYHKLLKERRDARKPIRWGEYAAKRRRIAVWVLRDMAEDLGRVPSSTDLGIAFGLVPPIAGRLNGFLGWVYGDKVYRTELSVALWAEAGLDFHASKFSHYVDRGGMVRRRGPRNQSSRTSRCSRQA